MKKYSLLLITALFTIISNGQKDKIKESKEKADEPKGNWKVYKEFDENGILTRYDSTYFWSSDRQLDNLSSIDRDSLIQSFKSRFFTNFSEFKDHGFDNIFSHDSLFIKHFFDDDFMDIEKTRQKMIEIQKKFLEKHKSEFIKPKEDN